MLDRLRRTTEVADDPELGRYLNWEARERARLVEELDENERHQRDDPVAMLGAKRAHQEAANKLIAREQELYAADAESQPTELGEDVFTRYNPSRWTAAARELEGLRKELRTAEERFREKRTVQVAHPPRAESLRFLIAQCDLRVAKALREGRAPEGTWWRRP